MRTTLAKFAAPAVGLMLAASLAACSTGGDTSGSEDPAALTRLDVSTSPSAGNASLYLPISDGSYEAAGLEVVPQVLQNGAQAVPLLLNNQIQIAAADPIGALAAISQGTPIMIVAMGAVVPQDVDADPNSLIVAADSAFTGLQDLNGTTIGVNALNGFAAVAAKAAIDEAGGDSSTIKWVEIPIPQMQETVANHTIDAAVTTEPFVTAAKAPDSGVKPLAGGGIAAATGGLPQLVYLASSDYVAQNPEVIKAFADAVSAASDKLNADPDLIRTVAKESTSADDALIDQITLPAYGTLTLASMSSVEKLAVKYGVLAEASTDLASHLFLE